MADIRHFLCTYTRESLCCTFFHIDSLIFTQRIYLISNKRTVFIIRPVCSLTVCCCSCIASIWVFIRFFFLCVFLFFSISFLFHSVYDSISMCCSVCILPLFFAHFIVAHSSIFHHLYCFECVCDFEWLHFGSVTFVLFCFVFFFRGSFPQCIFFA